MSRDELAARIREHHAAIHTVTVYGKDGQQAFWYECPSREAAEDDCDWMEAHGIDAMSFSGSRRHGPGIGSPGERPRKNARARALTLWRG